MLIAVVAVVSFATGYALARWRCQQLLEKATALMSEVDASAARMTKDMEHVKSQLHQASRLNEETEGMLQDYASDTELMRQATDKLRDENRKREEALGHAVMTDAVRQVESKGDDC